MRSATLEADMQINMMGKALSTKTGQKNASFASFLGKWQLSGMEYDSVCM